MSRRTAAILTPLYMSQFLGIGFLFTALSAILRERGASLEQLSVVYLFTLAWVVKFLWAPAVDRFGLRRLGHYRTWLIILQPSTALAVLALIPLDVIADLPFVLLGLMLVALLSATQDIATDALAVRLVHGDSRGTINGIQIGAGFIGDVLGGGLVLIVYGSFGWTAAITTLALLTLLPLGAAVWLREPAWEPVPPEARVRLSSVVTLMRQPGVARWMLVIIPLCVLGTAGAYALLVPMLVDVGWSFSSIALVTNTVGGIISIGAALFGGWLVPRFGRRRVLLLTCLIEAVVIAGLLPVASGAAPFAPAAVAVVAFTSVNAASWAVIYTINMDYARYESPGTDFTAQVAVLYLVRLGAGAGVTALAGSFGYQAMLLFSSGLSLCGLLAAWGLFRTPEPAARGLTPPERSESHPGSLAGDRTGVS